MTRLKTDLKRTRYSLGDLNALAQEDFVRVVGPVFEQSAWIAAKAAALRPFSDGDDLLAGLCDTVRNAPEERKIELIQSHPDLVDRLASLTPESAGEQAAAGLDKLTSEEAALFRRQNAAYREKFGFPFVICARMNKKNAIIAGFERRLKNPREEEIRAALEEIYKIADLRLRDLIEP